MPYYTRACTDDGGLLSKPITILDDQDRIVAVLVGRPVTKLGEADDWPEVVEGLEVAINKLQEDLTFYKKDEDHRRGVHTAKAFSVSHGGGQKVCTPFNVDNIY